MDEYQNNLGDINAEVIFIDSNVMSGQKKYRGYDVYNVDDIGDMPFTCIVVASSKYEREICQTVTGKYGNQFKLIRLTADLKF